MNRKVMIKAMVLAAALLSGTVALAADTRQFARTVAVGAQDRVFISNVAGDVNIMAWDRQEVDIKAELGKDVQQVDVRQSAGRLEIRVEFDRTGWRKGQDGSADLAIRVPAGVQVEVDAVSADVMAKGLRGRVRLKTVSGDLRAEVAATDVDLKSVSGDIRLVGTGQRARLRATSVSGGVDLVTVGGDVEARSTSGGVRIEAGEVSDLRAQSVSGGVIVRATLARDGDVEVQSVSGAVRIEVNAPAGFQYEVQSNSGRISSCFGAEPQRDDSGGRGKSMHGVLGEGLGTVRAQSNSGSVALCGR